MTAQWKDAGDHRPTFGAAGRAWLRAALLQQWPQKVKFDTDASRRDWMDTLPSAVEIITAKHVTAVVRWVAGESYRGKGYANGEWQIDWPALAPDGPLFYALWNAAKAARRAQTVRAARAKDAQITSLDAWLTADRAGTLAYAGALEPRGESLLQADQRDAFLTAMERRRDRWPRDCDDCGESFRPIRSNGVRCPACIARRREQDLAGRGRPRGRQRPTGEPVAHRTAEAPAVPVTHGPHPREPDLANGAGSAIVSYWAGFTSGGLSAYYAPDDPRSPLNQLRAACAQADRVGRRDIAGALRAVLAEAQQRDQSRRVALSQGDVK